MNILTQSSDECFRTLMDDDLLQKIVAPVIFAPTAENYTNMTSSIDALSRNTSLYQMRVVIEQADLRFRNSPGRTDRYYVKQTRERTLMTLFGELTFKRTEYIDRGNGTSFIYIDRKIGLLKRMRYDPAVCALIYETYSDQNSMIKAGKLIGERLHPFTMNDDRSEYWIPRQTVQKILLRFKKIQPQIERLKETPETLFVMADEKYIPLQRAKILADELKPHMDEEISSYRGHIKAQIKIAVVFHGRIRKTKKNGEFSERWELTEKQIFTYPEDTKNFWVHLNEDLARRYDMTTVRNIYVMGDGASWIKAGPNELRTQDSEAAYAADRFHCISAINKITKDDSNRKLLLDYAYKAKKDDFNKVAEALQSSSVLSSESYKSTVNYVLNQIDGLLIMNQKVKIGCSMEQAIQHILASPFTSVPKAYAKENLYTYVTARTAQQNGANMRLMYIKAIDRYVYDGSTTVDFRDEGLDLGIFDSSKTDPYYHFSLEDTPAIHQNH